MAKTVEEAWREWWDASSKPLEYEYQTVRFIFDQGYQRGAAHGAAEEREIVLIEIALGLEVSEIEARIRQRGEKG